jgi:hypothetical protein
MLVVPELGDGEWSDDHWPFLLACREELLDQEYAAYPHGRRATKALGCDGPMCRKANRDYGREVQRRMNGAQTERISAVRRYDAFLDAFIAYAATYHYALDVQPPKRRKLKEVRTLRRDHLIPLSVARMLHRSRARLAS